MGPGFCQGGGRGVRVGREATWTRRGRRADADSSGELEHVPRKHREPLEDRPVEVEVDQILDPHELTEPGVAGDFRFEPRMPEGYKRPTGPVGGGG